MANHHRRRRARDTNYVVMFGNPKAAIAPSLGVRGEIARVI